MSLSYDFDIQLIVPKTAFEDPKLNELLGSEGVNPNTRANYVALFRDQQTVAALSGASETVRDFFKASGFGFTVFDSGAGPGRYPKENEVAHLDVLRRLSQNMKQFDLKGQETNGFELPDFLAHIVAAKPIDNTQKMSAKPVPAVPPTPENEGFEGHLAEKAEAHVAHPAMTILKRAVVALTLYLVLWQAATYFGVPDWLGLSNGDAGSEHTVARGSE